MFSNFNASSQSDSTLKLFVDVSTQPRIMRHISSNNSMTCKIPANSGRDKRLSLMKYDELGDDYLDTRILSGCLVDYAQPIVKIVGCPSEGCARNGGTRSRFVAQILFKWSLDLFEWS